jgi:hypothetical protein
MSRKVSTENPDVDPLENDLSKDQYAKQIQIAGSTNLESGKYM